MLVLLAVLALLQNAMGQTHPPLCSFPTKMEGELYLTSSLLNEHLHFNFTMDLALGRAFMHPLSRQHDTGIVVHPVNHTAVLMDFSSGLIYRWYADDSCTKETYYLNAVPTGVPSSVPKKRTFRNTVTYYKKNSKGKLLSYYRVIVNRKDRSTCIPVVASERHNFGTEVGLLNWKFTAIHVLTSIDRSILYPDVSMCR